MSYMTDVLLYSEYNISYAINHGEVFELKLAVSFA